jgi:hypothetical protein
MSKNRITVNGSLLRSLFNGTVVTDYIFLNDTWHVLTNFDRLYTVHTTNSEGVFVEGKHYSGTIRKVLEEFKVDHDPLDLGDGSGPYIE